MSPKRSTPRVAPYAGAVPAVGRTMDTLEQLARASDGLTLAELARETRVSPSSLLAVLRTLERHGYVIQDSATRRYLVAGPLVALGRLAARRLVPEALFVQLARPLVEQWGQTISLWTLHGSQAVLVVAEEGARQVRFAPRAGLSWPAANCAVGYALLASLDQIQLARWHAEVAAREASTLALPALLEHLAGLRTRGYVEDQAALEPELYVVAVPVPGAWRGASLALAYAAPRTAHLAADTQRIAGALARIAEALGSVAQGPLDATATTRASQEAAVWLPGAAGPMDSVELQAFLDGPSLATLSCLKENGYPYSVPVWYQWEHGRFWVMPRVRAQWARYLQLDARASLAVGEPSPPLRRALVEGRAELVAGPDSGEQAMHLLTRMAARYLGPAAPAYLHATAAQPRRIFAITPERLVTWRGLAPHPRYDTTPSEPAARRFGQGVA